MYVKIKLRTDLESDSSDAKLRAVLTILIMSKRGSVVLMLRHGGENRVSSQLTYLSN